MVTTPRFCFVSGLAVWIAMLVAPAGAQTQSAAGQTSKQATAPAGNAAKGKQLFTTYGCWQCHGRQAQGSIAGSRLGPDPIPFPALVAYVRRPTNQMPPFKNTLVSDAELADIYAFLRSLPQPPPLESIQLLK